MSVVAPPLDKDGAALDAQIAAVQAVVNANRNLLTLYQQQQYLSLLQTEAVDHYMVTGWLNAATILATYSAPSWDSAGQRLAARVAFLQNLVNTAPANNPTNPATANPLPNYQQQLYAAQISLVERIMDVPGGTSAATMLANLTGFQSFVFEYVYSSTGFTEQSLEA